jgi:prepilin-type N-terminal cleavage/methylation domain-containing protein
MRERNRWQESAGFTLVELMITAAILGILVAVAVPVLSRYVKESVITEGVSNVQQILIAEQAFYSRQEVYTDGWGISCGLCPTNAVNQGRRRVWPANNCGINPWIDLGWRPDGEVAFCYTVFSPYVNGVMTLAPAGLPDQNEWGINWATQVGANLVPWVAVQATADWDGDNQNTFIRTNSVNQEVHRFPNMNDDNAERW